MKKYQPSNATEGFMFIEQWCGECIKQPISCDAKKQCFIQLSTMAYDIDDPEYPKEWIYRDDKPVCTAFKSREEFNASRRMSAKHTCSCVKKCDKTNDMFGVN